MIKRYEKFWSESINGFDKQIHKQNWLEKNEWVWLIVWFIGLFTFYYFLHRFFGIDPIWMHCDTRPDSIFC